MSKAIKAGLLSFVLPGLGQLYNGDVLRGVIWFVLALVFDITLFGLSMGFGSLIYHGLCAWAAYSRAREKSRIRWF